MSNFYLICVKKLYYTKLRSLLYLKEYRYSKFLLDMRKCLSIIIAYIRLKYNNINLEAIIINVITIYLFIISCRISAMLTI